MNERIPESRGEARWPVALAVIALAALLIGLPARVRLFPDWCIYVVGSVVLAALAAVPLSGRSKGWRRVEHGILLTFVLSAGTSMLATLAAVIRGMLNPSAELDGLALLTPARPLSPPAVASLAAQLPPVGAEVAVAGYGYEDQLPAATLTFGGLAAAEGLDGTAGQMRLNASLLPGDAGGPVLDARGAVVGLTLPAAPVNGRELPPGVAMARDAASLSPFLTGAGVSPTLAAGSAAPLPPEDLARAARGMTVLVSCWK